MAVPPEGYVALYLSMFKARIRPLHPFSRSFFRNLGGRFKLNQWPKDVVCTIRLAGLALIRLFPLLLEIGILVTPLLMISSLLLFKFQPALPADIATTFKLVGREANEEMGESSLNISPWPLSTQVISQRVATGD
ncbi:hypothetical protein CISIN_1g039714mg [Citrus sinensis]|uniref:Uncharacterized protein n=1 Tax=Citrus sinensis TaxID=2711 RepID=A0A067FI33_CITSI|nr:hypothetical protein CISIN_1g039714mg [Citrus sinensis]